PALRSGGAGGPRGGPPAGVQQADALVPGEPAGAGVARLLPAARARDARSTAAGGRPARAADPATEVRAGRERVPVAVRNPEPEPGAWGTSVRARRPRGVARARLTPRA